MQQQTKRQPGFEIFLDQEIKSLARRERELLVQLLVKIREMDVSEGYLLLGCSSIHEYLVDKVGYTNGSAQRRIDSARMLKDVPEVGEKIKEGTISMNQVTLIKKAVRQVSKTRPVSVEEKREIVAKIESMGERESQREVASFFDLPIIQDVKWKIQADGSVRLECTFTKEQAEQIRQAQNLVSHSVPSNNIVDFMEYVSARIIAQKTGVGSKSKKNQPAQQNVGFQPIDELQRKVIQEKTTRSPAAGARSKAAAVAKRTGKAKQNFEKPQGTLFDAETNSATTAMAVEEAKTEAPAQSHVSAQTQTITQNPAGTPAGTPLPLRLRKQMLREEPTCQYRDPKTGQRCGSRWMLQVDHRRPRWAGGGNSRDNLQTLCAKHNRWKYRREANLSK